MNIIYIVISIILLTFIVYQGRTILPRMAAFTGLAKRRFYFEDNLSGARDQVRREQMQPTIEKLEALGFIQLGVMLEKQPLWAGVTREIAMASSAEKIFVSLGFRHGQPSYFFYTPFTGGQMVITGYNSFRHYRRADFVSTVVTSGEPSAMLEEHKKLIGEFTDKGFTPYSNYNRETLVQATEAFYASTHTRGQLRTAASISFFFWVIVILIFVLFLQAAFR